MYSSTATVTMLASVVLLLLLRLRGDEMKFVPWRKRRVGEHSFVCSVVMPAKPRDLSRERRKDEGGGTDW